MRFGSCETDCDKIYALSAPPGDRPFPISGRCAFAPRQKRIGMQVQDGQDLKRDSNGIYPVHPCKFSSPFVGSSRMLNYPM
jgi:hypothetical protein